LLRLSCACADPDPTPPEPEPVDAARPVVRIDASPPDAAHACTGEFCRPIDDAGQQTADADATLEPADSGVDSAQNWEPIPPTFSATGETCLGLRELDFSCEPERCGPAHYSYVNLSVDPADVTCPGGEGACPEPLTDPQHPFYLNSRDQRGYQIITSWEESSVGLTIGFTVDIEFARNAAEAQQSINYANLGMDLDWEKAFWSDVDRNNIPGTTRIEVLSYEHRRLHLRAHDTAHLFNGGMIPGFAICGIEGACFGDGCWWADSDAGGSGSGPTIDLELAFTLPPAEKVVWVPAP
jgi:hypothetical protein